MELYKIILLLFLFLGFGCNYTKLKTSSENNIDSGKLTLPQELIPGLSYAVINQKVFESKCLSCHDSSSKINLSTYTDVINNISGIERSVFQERSMPKRGSLTEAELSYLWTWIRVGMPEFPQNSVGEPEPEPKPEPIQPTFESLNKKIFQVSCKDCHNPTGTGKRILLDKESILNSPLELVIPENPDESGLVLALEREDDKRMPPAKDGYSELSAEYKAAVRKWIENGAKD